MRHIKISIVIATYNRKSYILNTIKKLSEQTYPKKDYEIIVVDDGSSDGTFEELKKLKINNLRIFRQKNKGPASARNLGIKNAKYGIVAFTDDDCLPDADWLEKIAKYYKKYPNILGVGGIMYTPKEWIKPLTHHALPLEAAIEESKKFIFPPTSNVSYKKEALLKAGMFNESFASATTEDVELFIRVKRLGKVIVDNKLRMPHIAGKSSVSKEIKRFKNFYLGYKTINELYPKEFKEIYCEDTAIRKFRKIALSIPSLKKIFYYPPKYFINPFILIKLLYFFMATRLYIIKESLK